MNKSLGSDWELMNSRIEAIIRSSNAPMFFCDNDLNIVYCNDQFERLLNAGRPLKGQPASHAVDLFVERVPPGRREGFLKRQEILFERLLSDRNPNCEDIEYIDNRDLEGSSYQGLYKAWIHADCVRVGGERIGVFIFYHVTKLQYYEFPHDISKVVFVIMKFGDNQLNSAYEGVIKPLIQEAGLEPLRIDEVQDAGKITDQVLEGIATSRLVLADLSGERPNCYYEAGYAHSIGKELILTIRKGEKIHFDLAGHRFIQWETEAELRRGLSARLESMGLLSQK